ncbi:MAG: multicopper oxidase family protein [Bacteroidetes bacterium]|nr:multicopper oxidase family protein [Bacteroidota bacterium]
MTLLVAFTASLSGGQDHSGHNMGDMNMGPGSKIAWRMVPMTATMPMAPDMMDDVPNVAPFLPGYGMDVSMFAEAKPSEIIDLAHGDTLRMDASLVRRTIGGKEYVMMAYGGMYPGPLLRADRGSKVVVEFTNNIEMPTTVHWHGLRLDNAFDGVPGVTQDPILTGETFTYELIFPDEGMFWYHPHMREDVQQDLGLYGNMLVDPTTKGFYGPANREVPLILDDILIDDNGLLPFGESGPTHALMGRFGNVLMVNGITDYKLQVDKGDVVRFYLTNVANTRSFNVTFGGAKIKIVASDVSKYEREQFVPSVVISPAERYIVDVLFDETRDYQISNSIQAIDHYRGVFVPEVHALGRVSVSSKPSNPSFVTDYSVLRTNADTIADIDRFRKDFGREPDHKLRLTLKVHGLPMPTVRMMEIDTLYVPPMEWNDTMPMMNWLSSHDQVDWILKDEETGKENMDIQWQWKVGDVVKIRIFNDPKTFHPMNHPFHVHGQRFLVTSMDGVANTNLVWKDTAIVPVGATMDILVDVTNPGTWMAHCHIAEHLHSGMMLGFTVSK